MRTMLLSMLLAGCAEETDKGPAEDADTPVDTDAVVDTDREPAGGADDTDLGAEPGDDTDVAAPRVWLQNPSFEADVVSPGGYLSSASGAEFEAWSYEVSTHGYVSLWGGWERLEGLGALPAPGQGQNYLRFELWNTDQAPQSISTRLTSAPFGPAVGGASCVLNYAASEVDGYLVSPFSTRVAWSEAGFIRQEVVEDVALRTGRDAADGGAWMWLTMAFTLPAEADGQPLTITFEAQATNVTPGLSLAMLIDNVQLDCE